MGSNVERDMDRRQREREGTKIESERRAARREIERDRDRESGRERKKESGREREREKGREGSKRVSLSLFSLLSTPTLCQSFPPMSIK